MRFINNISLTALLSTLSQLTPTVSADPSLGSLKIDFNVKRGVPRDEVSAIDGSKSRFSRRANEDGAVVMELMNHQILYIAELHVGSNEDKVHVHVDTGSSDLWVMSSDVECTKENPFTSLDQEQEGNKTEKREQPSKSKIDYAAREKRADGQVYSSLYAPNGPETTNIPGSEILSSYFNSNSIGASGSGETKTCTTHGTFNTGASETFESNGTEPFLTLYGDGTYAFGLWGQDTIKIGNISVSDVSFAIANLTSNDIGVLGIGLPGLETTAEFGYTYENLPYKMKSDGVIDKVLYSLYLNEADANTGSVLFGAIDHAKYEGTLETLPLTKGRDGTILDFSIELNHISLDLEGETKHISKDTVNVILDSGTTASYLLPQQLKAVGESLGGEFIETEGGYKVDCEYLESNSTLDLTFGNKIIHVPFSDLVLPENETSCYLGILPYEGEANKTAFPVFGDNILRSAYIVYDLEDYQIHIGQAYYTDEENIEVVKGNVTTGGGQNSTTVAGGSKSNSTSTSNGASSGSGQSPSSSEQTNAGLSIYNLSWISVLGLVIPLSLV